MKTKKRNKKRKLQSKITKILLITTVALLFGIVTDVTLMYRSIELQSYRDEAYGFTRAASDYIDGDKVKEYIDNPVEDDYYNDVKNYLSVLRTETEIQYYYVFIPRENDFMYIWDADTPDDPGSKLGETDQYMKGGKKFSDAVMAGNGKEELILSKDGIYGYLALALSPIYDSDGNVVAVAAVELSTTDMLSDLLIFNFSILAVVAVLMAFAMTILYLILDSGVIKPIKKLDTATKQMKSHIESGEVLDPEVNTKDELEDLSDSFVNMEKELLEYIDENSRIMAEKERIGAELNVATKIQADMLPMIFPAFPDRNEFDIYASMTPAKEVGGDFYDFFFIDDDHLALVMADVSGKGVPAAMFMMMAKVLIQTYTLSGRGLKDIFTDVNNKLCEKNSKMFVTVWLGVLEVSTGHLSAINAGHEYPVIKNPNGDFEVLKDKHCFVLGGMEDMIYNGYEIQLEPGAKIFVYTDGVPEATDANEELFGMDRTVQALNSAKDGSPEEILSAVDNAVSEFVGDAEQFDDLTMLCVEYKGV